MLSLVMCLFLADGIETPKPDAELIRLIQEEVQRQKDLAAQKHSGCPFEPGTYWNVECA